MRQVYGTPHVTCAVATPWVGTRHLQAILHLYIISAPLYSTLLRIILPSHACGANHRLAYFRLYHARLSISYCHFVCFHFKVIYCKVL